MAQFDAESFRDYFVQALKDGLNAKLTAISAEKGDSLDLGSFADEQYSGDINSKVMNYDKYIIHEMSIGETQDTNGLEASMEIEMLFNVVFSNSEGGEEVENMLYRYSRAMAEILLEKGESHASIGDFQLRVIFPYFGEVAQQLVRVATVQITGTITI